MEIIKTKEHVLLKNDQGEYHLSHDKFKELGEKEAIIFAEKEITKKLKSSYSDIDIDFKRAKSLGFCEFGIKDFCSKLNLNIDETYKISYLQNVLNVETLLNYTNECQKLFGKNLLDKFGGPIKFLEDNRTESCLSFILNNNYISKKELGLLGCNFAESVLNNFEKEYPDDDRPRKAIEAKRLFIEGKIDNAAWYAANGAAWDAANSAANSATSSAARSATSSAANSAAWYAANSAARSATWDAVNSAAWDAARSAEIEKQIKMTLIVLKERDENIYS